jgi:hypothetical protein
MMHMYCLFHVLSQLIELFIVCKDLFRMLLLANFMTNKQFCIHFTGRIDNFFCQNFNIVI